MDENKVKADLVRLLRFFNWRHLFLSDSWPSNFICCFIIVNPLTIRVKPWVIQIFLTFDSIHSTLKCNHPLESY